MKNKLSKTMMLFLVVLPWPGIVFFHSDSPLIVGSCINEVNLEYSYPDHTSVLSSGQMRLDYLSAGKGAGTYTGTLTFISDNTPVKIERVYRKYIFKQQVIKSHVQLETLSSSTMAGDTASNESVAKYVYRGFTPGYINHYQIMKVSNSTYAIADNNHPRVICYKEK